MDEKISKRGYLEQHGAALADQGYSVIPINVGQKWPTMQGWQKSEGTPAQIKEWLEKGGHRNSGVGILTKHTPAIDIDVRDADMSARVEEWVRKNIGPAPLRVGRAPKRLMLFRTETPFRKMRTTKWTDEFGDEQQIEILADGQQFVAYHKHPDTGKPYAWPNEGDSPLDVPAHELTLLTTDQCQALIEWFDGEAFDLGWTAVKKPRLQAQAVDHSDNPWAEDSSPITITDEELRNRLMMVPSPEDYDQWIQVGQALYHQFDGDEVGLDMWNDWSETADNYDAGSLDTHWKSFDIAGKKRAPITARLIIKLAREAAATESLAEAMKLKDMFLSAVDLAEWEKARNATQVAEIDSLGRAALAVAAKESRDRLLGAKTPMVEIKKAIAFLPKNADLMPKWCAGWAYDTELDRFFHLSRKHSVTQQGFNAMFDRRALTKKDVMDGKTVPTTRAADQALNTYRIPVVDGTRYMPGNDAIFTTNEGTFANLYAEHEIPDVPEVLTPRDRRAVKTVERHLAHLLPEREGRLFLDWISWIVQNPGKHMNYAVLLQGVEGDGKTFFAEMLRAVMGTNNVTMLNAHILHSQFTDWTVGQCLACVEEVRLVNDGNKYEVLNRIKPNITNKVIEVHPKGKPIFNAINTTSYLLFSNYKDALPLDDNSRRYMVLFSKWQSKGAMARFNAENPDYFEDLYQVIEDCPGALRKWLLGHEQSMDFKPKGNAPDTAAKEHMVHMSKPEFIQLMEASIRNLESHLVGPRIVVSSGLVDVTLKRGGEYPAPKTLNNMMARNGYESLGRQKVGDEWVTVWATEADEFRLDNSGAVNMDLVQEMLDARKNLIEDDEL